MQREHTGTPRSQRRLALVQATHDFRRAWDWAGTGQLGLSVVDMLLADMCCILCEAENPSRSWIRNEKLVRGCGIEEDET